MAVQAATARRLHTRVELGILALLMLVVLAQSCGGRVEGYEIGSDSPPLGEMPASSLPPFPSASQDLIGSHQVSIADNILYGNEYFEKADPGATVADQTMVLAGPDSQFGAWASYQWSGFTGGLAPLDLSVELNNLAKHEFWVLISDYTSGHWLIEGPFKSQYYTYTYEQNRQYCSPNGNTYVAVITSQTGTVVVKKLNIHADQDIDPPSAPASLNVRDIATHTAELYWPSNPDKDVYGYRIYEGPAADFLLSDAGVSEVAETDFLTHEYGLVDLPEASHHYYRLTAFDVVGNESRPSPTCEFDTLANTAPVADFTWEPEQGQVDRPVSFDPSTTTDSTDLLDNLLFEWDFDNNGVFDLTKRGAEVVEHTYSQRRVFECRLRVSDPEQSSEVTKSLRITFRHDYNVYGSANGLAASVYSYAHDAATGQVAIGANLSSGFGIYYYHDGAWEWVSTLGITGEMPAAVCVSPAGLGLLTFTNMNWYVLEHDGSTWQLQFSGSYSAATMLDPRLAAGPAGRYSVAMITAPEPPFGSPPDFTLQVWQEKAGGGLYATSQNFGPDHLYPYAMLRDDANSFCAYVGGGNVSLLTVTDSSKSTSTEQACGDAFNLCLEHASTTPGELTWAAALKDGNITWGDNFGAANGAGQTVSPPEPAVKMMGLRPRGDNAAEFYWSGLDALNVSHLRGHDSSANSGAGASYDLGEGYGFVSFGGGGAMEQGADQGVYCVVGEERDGEINGYYFDSGSVLQQDDIYTPSGVSPAMGASAPIIFPDGSLSVFCQQPYPTAMRAHASALDAPFSVDQCGVDNYTIPNTACATGNGNEFMIASSTDAGDTVVNHYAADAEIGTEMLVVRDAIRPRLALHPDSSEIRLCYLANSSKEIATRTWDGSNWSAPSTIFSTTGMVMDYTLRPRPGEGWGVAVLESSADFSLVEQSLGLWSPPLLLGSSANNPYSGIGLAYSEAGDTAVALELGAPASSSIRLGQRPAGQASFNWQPVDNSSAGKARSTNVFYDLATGPVVFYYRENGFEDTSGVYVVEQIDGLWESVQFDFIFWSTTIGTAVAPDGNIVFSGVYGWPAKAVYAVIWR